MCGFAGVIAWDEKYRVSRDTLAKMSAAIAHRGPDGEGMYFSPDAEITPDRPQVALAHRRLAIIDPDPRGNQPFTDGDGRWLVYNGEIYNYRELRAELKSLKPDYHWRTDCDTEVLLVAYDVWGERCVEHFNGMFAFAIWDGVKKDLFLARDRMGQKPLYIRSADGVVHFGSEPGAISKGEIGSGGWLGMWLGYYLRYGSGAEITPWVMTLQLGPGTTIRFHRGQKVDCTRYFDAGRLPVISVDDQVAVSNTRTAVDLAVQRQLVSDVPLGVFLSGGIDSSVVALCARKHGPVKTFSVRFEDPRYDESNYAREVAVHLGTEHHELCVLANAAEDLFAVAAAFGEPFADSSALPTHYLSRETRRDVKVALSGDGGDELFGGYDRYRAMRWGDRLRPLRFMRALVGAAAGGHPKSLRTRAARFVRSLGGKPSERYDGYMRIFDEPTLQQLVPGHQLMFPLVEEAYSLMSQTRELVPAALACDRMRYLPDDLLTKVDRASMLHALEVRSPFMDHELVQFAAGLTTDQLLKGGPKRMLREAFADDLPAWVFKRKKMGFAVPIGEWFRAELRPMLHDNLFAADSFGATHFNMNVVRRLVDEHEQFKVDHSQRLYALLMLELWWRGQRA